MQTDYLRIYPTLATSQEAWLNILNQVTVRFQQLKPREQIKLSEWAVDNFYLSKDYSPEDGLYSYSRRGYQKEILDEIGYPENRSIVIVGGTQVIKTLAIMIFMTYMIVEDPGPALYITTTKEKAAEFSRTRLDAMIRDNLELAGRIQNVGHKKADTILIKKFINGFLNLVGSNSPSGLISSTIRYLFVDEIDAYKQSAGQSGDQIELAVKRTTEFENSKVIYTSSPGVKGMSRIIPLFEATDMRFLFVPCPECGHFQRMRWGGPKEKFGFKWIDNDPSKVYYLCENDKCATHIPEEEKHAMFTKYEWRQSRPEVKNKPGFFIPRLYSPTASWSGMVEDFLKANRFVKQGDKTFLQVFVNTTLAELWDPAYGLPDEEQLLQRIENYYSGDNPTLPEKVCTITAFTDTQPSFLHTVVVGWGIGEESWRLMRIIMPGNPDQQFVWNELDIFLQRKFIHPLGLPLLISAAGVDTGGHNTDAVYAFVKNKHHRRIYGTKGANQPGKPIAPKQPSMNNKGGIPLYMVGTDTAKEVVFGRLKIEKTDKWKEDEAHPGFMHFNQCCDADYFEQLVSEKQVMKKVQGLYVPAWEEIPNRRHEDLDCEVGNLAVLRISRQNLSKIYDDLKTKSAKLKEGTLFDQPKAKQQSESPTNRGENFATSWKK